MLAASAEPSSATQVLSGRIPGGSSPRAEVDQVCQRVLSDALAALAPVGGISAVLLAGSLAAGRACGTLLAGRPALLSDVDLAVVPAPDAGRNLREELQRRAGRLNRALGQHGLLSHVEIGILSRRSLLQPDDRLFLHDLAAHGRTLAGDPQWLERLRAALRGRVPAPVEGERLVLNRLAGQLYMLPWFGSDDPQLRLVARYHFAKVYADHETALRLVLGDAAAAGHQVVVKQAPARARWAALRNGATTEGDDLAALRRSWRECLRDQVETAEACAGIAIPRPRPSLLRDLAAWLHLPAYGRSWSERLGLSGPPLAVAHAAGLAAARELLGGAEPAAWAARTRDVVGLWRTAVAGVDDTPVTFVPDALRFLTGDAR